ncbi:MAG: thioredoxin family protein, partial [Candidatus Aenigmatarchaeota archaeon]
MKDIEEIKKEKMEEIMEKKGERQVRIEVGTNDFEQKVIEKSKEVPIVVDFWSPSCQPCLVIGPILEKVAKKYGGKFVLAKVNINDNLGLAQRYGVSGIPTIKMFKGGEIVD